MITQIEIDGFKTFKDFKVELAPFQVIVGPNGSGKSNLFDALQLLSQLARTDLFSAFQGLRGEAGELFTRLPDGKASDRMNIAVELLVDRKIRDDLGRDIELKYTRLRYELEIIVRTDKYDLDQFYIQYESLKVIPGKTDNWYKKHKIDQKYIGSSQEINDEDTVFSFTQKDKDTAVLTLHHQPPLSVGQITLLDEADSFHLKTLTRTVLSSSSVAQMYYAIAVRKEFDSLQFFHLNPEALRASSSTKSLRYLSQSGENLPATLARIQAEDQSAFHLISLDMANLVPDILDIEVEKDQVYNEYRIYAKTADQRSFSAQVLSDGTLRLLALATLRNDPQSQGILCLEEPENGVQPLYLKKMARLLREMATDFNDPQQAQEPLRQVLITTHSPLLISQPDIIDSLLLAFTPVHIQGKDVPSMRITRMVPVLTSGLSSMSGVDENGGMALEVYTIDIVRNYLDSESLDEARDRLKKARIGLNER